MRRPMQALGVLSLAATLMPTTRLTADEPKVTSTPKRPAATLRPKALEFRPVTAMPPKPLDLKTYRNRAFDAYSKALAEGKYTLLLFSYDHKINGFARRMEKKLTDPYLAIYSAYFIAAITEDRDEGGRQLAAALNIHRYPTVIVLKTDMDRLHVVGRIEGVFDVKAIDKVLRESLKAQDAEKASAERDEE